MRITILGPSYPYRGGIAEFNNRLAKQFASEGHEVDICTFSLQYPKFFFPGKTQYTEGPVPEGITITRCLNSVNPLNWIKVGRIIRKKRPDVLLLRFWLPFMAPSTGTVARIARMNKFRYTKVICVFDNVIPHEKRPFDRFLTRYFLRSLDGAVVMSQSVMVDLEKAGSRLPVLCTHHPVYDTYGNRISREEALNKLNLDPDYRYLLFFGFIRPYKGLDLLLEAMADSRLRKRKIRLIVAGEFYESDVPYREIIDKNGIADRVILENRFIRNDEIPAFFSLADMVVQPYKSASQSGVTQIAYHFEKPMLVTDTGALKEMVVDGKSGYVVSPDFKSVADAINDFFENDRKNQLVKGVIEEKTRFGWNKMTETITEVFLKCLLTQIVDELDR